MPGTTEEVLQLDTAPENLQYHKQTPEGARLQAPEKLADLIRKSLWRRKWQSTPVFLPGKCQGQRLLVGYSPWGPKELDMT